ncbi:hypothetical protein SAMN02745180_02933 [Sporanaerobacter acetigenes DSM 13106]|uniref:ATP-binding cassette, subfamily B n=1 Tax=Sporanaerobacter acetigenes DSM 13106 TaxID=1123281 RepID=A0A1M5ZBX9_9FIRM|nr:hypothetical protein SAMN02745180_02933 [Sporanaerobacter acetigenes DSM 13106]
MKTNQEINDIRKFFCNIKSIIVYSWKIDKRYILLIIASSIITSLINVFNIYILKYLADAIVTNKDKNYIIIIGLMLLVGKRQIAPTFSR